MGTIETTANKTGYRALLEFIEGDTDTAQSARGRAWLSEPSEAAGNNTARSQ
jgi:hypothetical protein